MPGWRMGFAAGNLRLINALTRMKSYLDYGAFTPIQVAAVAALTGPQECVAEMRALYKDRRDVLIKGLISAGWDMPMPDGSMFAWAPIPARYASLGSVEFSKLLLARAKVAVSPVWALASRGTGMSGSLWWRTTTGCARRCGTSGRFCRLGPMWRKRRKVRWRRNDSEQAHPACEARQHKCVMPGYGKPVVLAGLDPAIYCRTAARHFPATRDSAEPSRRVTGIE